MSRSKKKAIYKDKAFRRGRLYHKPIRLAIKKYIHNWDFDRVIPIDKEIVNDYDYSDYTIKTEYRPLRRYGWYHKHKGMTLEEAYQDNLKFKQKMSRK